MAGSSTPCLRLWPSVSVALLVESFVAVPGAFGQPLEQLATRAGQAGDLPSIIQVANTAMQEGDFALAYHAFKLAAELSLGRASPADIAAAYEAAANAAQKTGLTVDAAEMHYRAAVWFDQLPGGAAPAIDHCRACLELAAGEDSAEAATLIVKAAYLMRGRDAGTGGQYIKTAEEMARRNDARVALAVMLLHPELAYQPTDDETPAQSLERVHQAVDLLRSHAPPELDGLRLWELYEAAVALTQLGDIPGATAALHTALSLTDPRHPERYGGPQLDQLVWTSLVGLKDPSRALPYAWAQVHRELALAKLYPSRSWLAILGNTAAINTLWCLHTCRAHEEAFDWLLLRTAATDTYRSEAGSRNDAHYWTVLGVSEFYAGNLEAAQQALASAAARVRPSDGLNVQLAEAVIPLWRGRVSLEAGMLDEAAAAFDKAWKGIDRSQWYWVFWQRDFDEAKLEFALVRLQQGKTEDARALAAEGLRQAEEAKDLASQADALALMSLIEDAGGNAQEAAKCAERAIGLASQTRDAVARTVAAYAAMGVYDALGAEDVSASVAMASLRYGGGSERGLPYALRRRGRALMALGKYDSATKALETAFRLDKMTGNAARQCDDLCALGSIAAQQGEWDRAAEYAKEARQAARASGYRMGEADALLLATRAYLQMGDNTEAEQTAGALAALAEELSLPPLQAASLALCGQAAEANGKDDDAISHYVRAAGHVEGLRMHAGSEALQIRFGVQAASITNRLISLLARKAAEQQETTTGAFQLNDPVLIALHYAEAERARVLLKRMAGVLVERLDEADESERAWMASLDDAIAQARRDLWDAVSDQSGDHADIEKLVAALKKAQAERDIFRTRLLAKYPSIGVRAGEERIVAPDEVMQVCIDHSCAALEYWIGERESWGWVINPWKRQVKLFRVNKNRQELADLINLLQHELAKNPRGGLITEAIITQLSDALLGGIGPLLQQVKRLVIIPDGPLYDLPFALLTWHGKQLIEWTPVAYAPSLSLVRALGDVRWPMGDKLNVVVLARPRNPDPRFVDLPGTETEAQAVAEVVGPTATILLGDKATEAAAHGVAGRCDILHLAAHGLLDPEQPAHSALLLTPGEGQDGLLEAEEIAGLPIVSKLVVLSACRSASGAYVAGEGLLGLTRAFFAGGARGIVASQWQVPDEQVGELMKAFYKNLATMGDPARALQAAQIHVAQSLPPSAWAPFLFVGVP